MPEEIGSSIENLENVKETNYGDLKIYSGQWFLNSSDDNPILISIAWSGWGKVSAARAATRLISHSNEKNYLDLLIFTGVAGAAKKEINQWDIVIATKLIQHDMDARPLFNKFVIPALNKAEINSMKKWVKWAHICLSEAVQKNELNFFNKVLTGLIATGDKFIAKKTSLAKISKELPDLYAIEMEGAAVAQVAVQEEVPWLIVRVISDEADDSASQDFTDFLKNYQNYSWNLIKTLLIRIKDAPWDKN